MTEYEKTVVSLLQAILDEVKGVHSIALDKANEENEVWTPSYAPDPTPPYIPQIPDIPGVPNLGAQPRQCPRCGIELTGVMSYSCSHSDCPTGLGPVTC